MPATVRPSVETPEVREAGLKAAVTPVGRPERERAMVPANPFSGVTVTVKFPPAPNEIVCEPGAAVTLKSGGGLTIRITAAVFDSEPLVPVTVRG